jgi:pimeloyl-ACP methyl ester carboxylesterase
MYLASLTVLGSVLAQARSIPSLHARGDSAASGLNGQGFTDPVFHLSAGSQSICVSGIIPVTASTNKGIDYNYQLPSNISELTNDVIESVTPGSPFPKQVIAGTNKTITGTYDIYSTLCVSANQTGSIPSTVELLTHGQLASSTYWDFTPGYSYIDDATARGYAVFTYDRLSTGQSSKPDALEVQPAVELEILHTLATMLRSGKFNNTPFTKILGVGHSYGSILTQGLTSTHPTDIDLAVLTGFSAAPFLDSWPLKMGAANVDFASHNQPYRFSDLSNGYVVSDKPISWHTTFFYGAFDPAILALSEATKEPATLGEIFSSFTIDAFQVPSTNFTGPVADVTGNEDWPNCNANCSYPSGPNYLEQTLTMLYPNRPKDKTEVFVPPETGHFLTMHYSAGAVSKWIHDFYRSQGF